MLHLNHCMLTIAIQHKNNIINFIIVVRGNTLLIELLTLVKKFQDAIFRIMPRKIIS